jgi:hypothetical protein
VLGKYAPDFSGLDRVFCTRTRLNAQILKPNSLRIKHAENVVIGRNKQFCGASKRPILGKPFGVCMAMRAYDRQVSYTRIKGACQILAPAIRRKKPIFTKQWHISFLLSETLLVESHL